MQAILDGRTMLPRPAGPSPDNIPTVKVPTLKGGAARESSSSAVPSSVGPSVASVTDTATRTRWGQLVGIAALCLLIGAAVVVLAMKFAN
jgi:hypothetical protein